MSGHGLDVPRTADKTPTSGAIATAATSPSLQKPLQQFGSDALNRLPPAQIREMRESFQVLDQDNDSQVTREDVAKMLNELGMQDSRSSGQKAY